MYKSVAFIEKRPQRPDTGIKDGFEEEMNTNFRLQYSIRKNRTTFSEIPLLPEIFRWNDPESRIPFVFQLDLPETCCKW